jgi:hypothetical protein
VGYGCDVLLGRPVRAAAQPLVGELGEGTPYQVQPTSCGVGAKLQVTPVAKQTMDLLGLVGGGVVHDKVDVEDFWAQRLMRFKRRRNFWGRWRTSLWAITIREDTSRAA